MKLRELLVSFILMLLAVSICSCSKTKSKTEIEYMPDMVRTPAIHAQEIKLKDPNYRANRIPVPGTVPRDFEPYPYATVDTVSPALELVNPLPRTLSVLETGRKYYNNFCIVCHGAKGEGNGYIVPKFPAPPSLLTDKILNWEDGRIYHMITRGRGNMPGYYAQLDAYQRWAIVHYVRALLRAAYPTKQDLEDMKRLKIDFSIDEPDTTTAALWPKK